MTLVEYILGGIFIVFVAIMSMRHHPNRGKSYEQRRDELYEYSQQRMEEFKATEMKPRDPELQADIPEAEASESGLEAGEPEGDPEDGSAEVE